MAELGTKIIQIEGSSKIHRPDFLPRPS